MMKKYVSAIGCLLCILAMTQGCRTTSERETSSIEQPSRGSSENVKLFLTDKPAGPYREIARVSAYKFTVIGIPKKQDEIYKVLREEAAAKGANAIINITEDIGSVYGVAILLQTNADAPSASSYQSQTPPSKTSSTQQPPAGSSENVKLFLTGKPTVPYKEIARVSSYKFTVIGIPKKQDEIYKVLKEEAAAKGANAIINITEDIGSVYGVAVLLQMSAPKKQPVKTKAKPSK